MSEVDQVNAQRTLRPELADFAYEMERVLQANDHKGDWPATPLAMTLDDLFRLLHREHRELAWAVQPHEKQGVIPAHVQHEAIDVANFALMIWAKARSL